MSECVWDEWRNNNLVKWMMVVMVVAMVAMVEVRVE